MTIDGRTYTIIGVAPPRFRGLSLDNAADAWIVSRTPAPLPDDRAARAGRHARAGAGGAQVLFQQLAQTQPAEIRFGDDMRVTLVPAGRGLSGCASSTSGRSLRSRPWSWSCSHHLHERRQPAHGPHAGRRRELAIRARSARGARGCCGCTSWKAWSWPSWAAARAGHRGLGRVRVLSMLPLAAPPEALSFHADARTLAFVAAASLVSALLFGLAPAWRASQGDLARLRSSPARARARSPAASAAGWSHARSACPCCCWSAPASSSRRSAT